eukprot:g3045.t1
MGIKGLSQLLSARAPESTKEETLKAYTGRKVAIDASMAIYQFLVAVRTTGSNGNYGGMLTNEAGETTSHLQGTFFRTIRIMAAGLKPCYVFDGAAPDLKRSNELIKRKENREKAALKEKEAQETGNQEDVEKYQKRQVRMTGQHIEDCMKLLRLMGMPVVQAPGEAEAQCAELVKKGKVWGMASEDTDSLTFGANRLLRRLTFPESRKLPVLEIHLNKVLEGLDLTMDQFIDVCILSGCDYSKSIRGIGPKKAHDGIVKYGSIEKFLDHLDTKKYKPADDFMENLPKVRELFKNPLVTNGDDVKLEWKDADEEGVVAYLCGEQGFNEDRIRSGLAKLKKAKKATAQKRIDSFFTFKPSLGSIAGKKRKAEAKKSKSKSKKSKSSFFKKK